MSDLIEVRNLGFSYKEGEPVLKGVSFSIKRGELLAVTGPSGSGKSTLFYLLGTLASRFSGEIIVDGKSFQKMSSRAKSIFRNQKIGFVFQQFHLLARATVLDNVLLPTYYPYDISRPTEQDRERALAILEKLGLQELKDRRPQELSGGQQQRVAIARALIRDPEIILADEPTGNLDSKSAAIVMDILRQLHREGKTVIIVTHSPEIAGQCQRVLEFKDGELVIGKHTHPNNVLPEMPKVRPSSEKVPLMAYVKALRTAWDNIIRTKAKAALTMLGVVLGIAAVLTTISLGGFAREKILDSYQTLGVNTSTFNGWPNWRRSSRDYTPAVFRSFDWDRDVQPMLQIFDEVERVSPVITDWDSKFNYGGQTIEEDTAVMGVNDQFYFINNQDLAEGRILSVFDMDGASPVCVIGAGVKKKLFRGDGALDKTITMANSGDTGYACRVVGVLKHQVGQSDNNQPDLQIYTPYTYLIRNLTNTWRREVRELRMRIRLGHDPDQVGNQLKGYFKSRYGESGEFNSYSNAKVIEQMKLFLAIFSSLLTAVAVIALLVGGVGINNMMLVNLSERLKELGLRKALGATPSQIRALVLTESILLCVLGGVLGLTFGFIGYEALIFAATKLIPNVKFEWVFVPSAVILSAGAIVLTGILSGLVPAIRAERLEVIEALRQE